MTTESASEGLGAALIQLSDHAERIGGLDAREASHHEDITARLGELASSVGSLGARVNDLGNAASRQVILLAA